MGSGRYPVGKQELELLWVSVCCPEQEADTRRWAELEKAERDGPGALSELCTMTASTLGLFSYISQHPFYCVSQFGLAFYYKFRETYRGGNKQKQRGSRSWE